MARVKLYNPVIKARLNCFFEAEDWDGLTSYLQGLSHADFRLAGNMIGELFMPSLPEDAFWMLFYRLLVYHAKAFLMTLLKSVPLRVKEKRFSLHHNGFLVVSNYMNTRGTAIDKKKMIRYLLTVLDDVNEIDYLLERLHVDTPKDRLELLLRSETMAGYYVLFLAMRGLEHDKELLARCCCFLMKKGDTLSFNLASVAKVYFDLPQVRGTFS